MSLFNVQQAVGGSMDRDPDDGPRERQNVPLVLCKKHQERRLEWTRIQDEVAWRAEHRALFHDAILCEECQRLSFGGTVSAPKQEDGEVRYSWWRDVVDKA